MGFGSRALLAGSLGFAAAFAVACGGSSGLLTAGQGSTLSAQLDSVSQAVSAHDCGGARSAATALNNAIADLPQSVSTTLVQNLGQGAATISALASRDCASTATSTSTVTKTSTSTSSTTTTTSTPTTTSSPTSTTATQTNSNTTTATNTNPTGITTAPSGGAGLSTSSTGNGGGGQ